MIKINVKIVLLFISFFSTQVMFGWGGGHDYVNRAALKIMPQELKDFLGKKNLKKFAKWSHAPDTRKPLQKEQGKYPLTDKEIKYLQSFRAKDLYSLHSQMKPGQAGNFILLVRAFMDKDPVRSAFWMSALMHTIADDVACNHTPQIHYLTYGFKAYKKLKIGNGIGLDFADIAKTAAGQKAITLLLKNYHPQPFTGSPEAVLKKIMTINVEAATYGTIREDKIIATYASSATPQVRQQGIKAMAELGIYGAIEGMNIILTAWKFAQQGKIPVLTKELMQAAAQTRKAYLNRRPLSDDSIYSGLLRPMTGNRPKIGILLERSGLMMSSKLSFGGRLVMAAAMRTLHTAKIPYNTIDLRDLNNPDSNVLDVKKIPLLILCSGNFRVSNNVKKNLKRYFAAGGRILWVAGRDKGILSDLSKSLKPADPKILPVTKKYGQNNLDVIDKIKIKFLPPFNKALTGRSYIFINNPDTRAGFQAPLCTLKVEPVSDRIKPLVELSVDSKTITIAAALMDKKGSARAIFIPEYLLAPFLLVVPNNREVDVANITLDSVGTQVLLQSLKLLKL